MKSIKNLFRSYIMEVLILCSIIFGISSAAKLPSYITPCHQSDPRLSECVIRAMEDVRPHLKGGIPEFQLPSMNPLILPQATLDTGANFKATFKNIEVYYIDEFNFKRVNMDLKNNFVDMVLSFSRLRIKSIYNIQGRLLVLQLNGNGPADGNFTNAEVAVTMRGPRLTRNGKQYFKFNQNKLDLKFGRSSMRFDNLFENNEELNMQTNRAINENIDNIIEELRPVLTEVIGKFIFGLIGKIFDKFSVEELFPQ